jgi:hypothetical protein
MTIHKQQNTQVKENSEQLKQAKVDVDTKSIEIEKMTDELNMISATNVRQKSSIEITKKNIDEVEDKKTKLRSSASATPSS